MKRKEKAYIFLYTITLSTYSYSIINFYFVQKYYFFSLKKNPFFYRVEATTKTAMQDHVLISC